MQFRVEGMMCSGCSSALEKQMRSLPGVSADDVSLEQKLLTVEVDEQVTIENIIDAVAEAGFEAFSLS